ncbi:hypothetical protein [Methylobacterium tardum]|uniref:Uncharacterized protein n=1 Tax=Methylobacterium tardum TaxID=374432 RepID=A0AA37THK3_9HYPH|nr:hypothetical protein [Methylobacterium tardum]URD39479.1 hypothetical protein M6G65_14340 [Methylobacterium tardum]GLS73670.1 hypothetical protein GCM10007890_56850 [Methylobacterium tardum]
MPNFLGMFINDCDNARKFHSVSLEFQIYAYDLSIDEGWATKMRELRRWIIAFLVIEAAWMTYLLMACSATHISVSEQSGMSNFSPFYLMPVAIFLFSIMGLWLIAALARVSILFFRSIIQP